jgi:hypothetical protein
MKVCCTASSRAGRGPAPTILLCVLLTACAGGGDTPCRVGSDCASGICFADGTCAETDAGMIDPDAGMPDRDAGMLFDPDAGAIDPDAGMTSLCDDDGVIDADELPLAIDETVSVRVAFDAAIDTHGVERPDGTRLWDYEGAFAGDEHRVFMRRPIAGEWFAGDFPEADYSFPIAADDLRGVFDRSADAVLLVGIVSELEGRTSLTYDPPVAVWRFPLREGASWEESTTVSGVLNSIASYYLETWSVAVDAAGSLGTPAGVRDVLRVNTRITRTAAGTITLHRRIAFVEPCVGTVGQVFGAPGDGTAEPTFASELWRVAP